MANKYAHNFWQRFSPLSEIMNIFESILGSLKMILFEPIYIHLVLGFQHPPFQVSNKFRHDAWMIKQRQARPEPGMWQLTPAKQESRPEIQDVR